MHSNDTLNKGLDMAATLSQLILQLDTAGDIAAEQVITQLVKIGPKAIPDLIKAAQDPSKPRIRKWSLLALGTIGDLSVSPILTNALRDERMTVKLCAMQGLARMNDKSAASHIVLLLTDQSAGVRVNAIGALIKLNDAITASQIAPLLKDPMWSVRLYVCKAVKHFQLKETLKTLQNLAAHDPKTAVRNAATAALENILS